MTASSFVDSNVLVYAVGATAKGQAARECLDALVPKDEVVISAQVVAEVFVNVLSVVGEPEAARYCLNLLDTTSVQTLDAETSRLALRLHSRYEFSYWDSQILAAAIASGARCLLTEDMQDGQVIEGVTVVNPFRPGFDPSAL